MSQTAPCHPSLPTSQLANKLLMIWGLSVAFWLLECIGAWWSGSLMLWADAGHMMVDSFSLLFAWIGQISHRYKAPERYTFGWRRVELLAGLANGGLLLTLALGLLQTAWLQWQEGSHHLVKINVMLPIAAIGCLANLWFIKILHPHQHHLSIQGALWHLLGDAFNSILVLLAALLVAWTGSTALDTLLTFPIAIVLLLGSLQLLRQALPYLLLAGPEKLNGTALAQQLQQVQGVQQVVDLHCFMLTSEQTICTATIDIAPHADPLAVLAHCQTYLQSQLDHAKITLQIQRGPSPQPSMPPGHGS